LAFLQISRLHVPGVSATPENKTLASALFIGGSTLGPQGLHSAARADVGAQRYTTPFHHGSSFFDCIGARAIVFNFFLGGKYAQWFFKFSSAQNGLVSKRSEAGISRRGPSAR
jgi:hypothetical protein